MGSTALAITKAAATLLSSEKGRKAIGWTLVAILSPFILVIAFLCCLGSGAAEHNIATVDYCFHGGVIAEDAPAEYTGRMNTIRSCFGLLDTAIHVANSKMPSGLSLDAEEIKSSFLALCAEKPSLINVARFVGCFFTTERRTRTVTVEDEEGNKTEKEETYTVNIPVSRNTAYSSLATLLGRSITADDQTNIDRIYALACGVSTGGDYDGDYLRGDGAGANLDISGFADPATKNATTSRSMPLMLGSPAGGMSGALTVRPLQGICWTTSSSNTRREWATTKLSSAAIGWVVALLTALDLSRAMVGLTRIV